MTIITCEHDLAKLEVYRDIRTGGVNLRICHPDHEYINAMLIHFSDAQANAVEQLLRALLAGEQMVSTVA